MTLRELLDQHGIRLDQELLDSDVRWRREPVEGPPAGFMRRRVPGPQVEIDIHISIDAAEVGRGYRPEPG